MIDKFLINYILVNILIFAAIVRIFPTIPEFYKVDISSSIVYKSTAVEYFLVTDIFI